MNRQPITHWVTVRNGLPNPQNYPYRLGVKAKPESKAVRYGMTAEQYMEYKRCAEIHDVDGMNAVLEASIQDTSHH